MLMILAAFHIQQRQKVYLKKSISKWLWGICVWTKWTPVPCSPVKKDTSFNKLNPKFLSSWIIRNQSLYDGILCVGCDGNVRGKWMEIPKVYIFWFSRGTMSWFIPYSIFKHQNLSCRQTKKVAGLGKELQLATRLRDTPVDSSSHMKHNAKTNGLS